MRLEIVNVVRTCLDIEYKEGFEDIVSNEVGDIEFRPWSEPDCVYNLEEEIEMENKDEPELVEVEEEEQSDEEHGEIDGYYVLQ